MKPFVLVLALSLGCIAGAPVAAPDHATRAAADDDVVVGTVVYRRSFPFIIEWTYRPGGWIMTNAWYDMSIGF